MCDQFFSFQVPQRIFQLFKLDKEIVFGIQPFGKQKRWRLSKLSTDMIMKSEILLDKGWHLF